MSFICHTSSCETAHNLHLSSCRSISNGLGRRWRSMDIFTPVVRSITDGGPQQAVLMEPRRKCKQRERRRGQTSDPSQLSTPGPRTTAVFVAVLAPAALATVTAISRGRESETKSNQIVSLLGDELGDEVAEGGAGESGDGAEVGKRLSQKTREREGGRPRRRGRGAKEGERDDRRARGADDRLMPTSMSIRATCAKLLVRP